MDKKIKTLGISLDGVVRDFHSQFDKTYRKFFIKNDSLVSADENFQYILPEHTAENQLDKLEKLVDEKIHLPVDTYDLMNHYYFDSKDDFKDFFQNYAFELYGVANQFPRSFDTINRIQAFGKANGLFEVVLLIKGDDKVVNSTYHFLAKGGCKINKVVFVNQDVDKWNYCDVLIDDSPESFESKPIDKTSIKISYPYNAFSDVDYSFESVNAVYNEMFLLKIFNLEKYEEVIAKQKTQDKND